MNWSGSQILKLKKFTNPVRYSFLGKMPKIHTPFAQLIKLGRVKDFDDLFRRFNIEVVGDEFFSSYKSLYIRLKEYLEKDKISQNFQKLKILESISLLKNY